MKLRSTIRFSGFNVEKNTWERFVPLPCSSPKPFPLSPDISASLVFLSKLTPNQIEMNMNEWEKSFVFSNEKG